MAKNKNSNASTEAVDQTTTTTTSEAVDQTTTTSESGEMPPPAPPQKSKTPPPAPPQKSETPPPAPPQKSETPPPAPPQKSKFQKRCEEIAESYSKHYPDCEAFHICSDLQVFLGSDLRDAQLHQAEIGTGQITTIKIR